MAAADDWDVPVDEQPRRSDYAFDIDRALAAVVTLSARIPADAFTAQTLGTERAGNGVLIRDDGIILTIGYLVTEATEVWLTTRDGRVVPGHVAGFDQVTGFGIVQALGPLGIPSLAPGDSRHAALGDRMLVGAAGGRSRSVAGTLVARQEFAGYWEYLLDEALFTAPAHPHWGGTALIGGAGELIGIGSLQLQHRADGGKVLPLNMAVPIELLPPVLEEILRLGRSAAPPRPWLGLFAADEGGRVLVAGFAGNGPARRAGLHEGDAILAVAGQSVKTLAEFYRKLWRLGTAGVDVPLTLEREGDVFDVKVTSADRYRLLRVGPIH
jgi:S1-C subfamily serine protease